MSRKGYRNFTIEKLAHLQKKPSVAKQALNLAKKVDKKQKMGQDLLQNTINVDGTTSTTASATYLTNLARMTGNSVILKSVHVKGVIKQNLTSTALDGYRCDLVLDRIPNKVALTALALYYSATPPIHEFKAFTEKGRFKILKSWRGYFNESTKVSETLEAYFKLNLKAVSSVNDSISSTEILRNALYLVIWTDASANQPTYDIRTRVVYEDPM